MGWCPTLTLVNCGLVSYLDTSELWVDGLLDDGLEAGGDERDWSIETHVAVAQDHSRLTLLLTL